MKNKIFLFCLMVFGVLAMPSCTYDSFEEESILGEIPNSSEAAFVRFDNSVSTVDATELDGSASVRVEFIFPIETDVTVNYTYSGTAVEGTDFTIDGGSGGSGSITVAHDAASLTSNSADLTLNLLTDDTIDGMKDLTVTLTSASAADGTPINVGQAGMFTEVTFVIADSDM